MVAQVGNKKDKKKKNVTIILQLYWKNVNTTVRVDPLGPVV